jgi:hypothetical protein
MFSGFARRIADPDVPILVAASGGGESPMLVDNIIRPSFAASTRKFGMNVGLKLWTS